jgi:hypothetical protein
MTVIEHFVNPQLERLSTQYVTLADALFLSVNPSALDHPQCNS